MFVDFGASLVYLFYESLPKAYEDAAPRSGVVLGKDWLPGSPTGPATPAGPGVEVSAERVQAEP